MRADTVEPGQIIQASIEGWRVEVEVLDVQRHDPAVTMLVGECRHVAFDAPAGYGYVDRAGTLMVLSPGAEVRVLAARTRVTCEVCRAPAPCSRHGSLHARVGASHVLR